MKITLNTNPYKIDKIKHIDFDEFLNLISKQHYKIKKHREKILENDEKYDKNPYYKRGLPKIIFEGLYHKREQIAYIDGSSTGLMLIDIDDVSNYDRLKEILMALKPLLIFKSVSGDLKLLFKTDVHDLSLYRFASNILIKNIKNYLKNYEIVENLTYKIDYTPPCVGTYLTFDPNHYHNPSSPTLHLNEKASQESEQQRQLIEKRKEKFKNMDFSKQDDLKNIKNLINYLEYYNYCMTENYHDWVQIGYALFNSFEDDVAEELFYQFSTMSDKFEPRSFQRTVKGIVKDKYNELNENKVTIASIFYKAQQFYHFKKADMEKLAYITFNTIQDNKPRVYSINVEKETKSYIYIPKYKNIKKKRIKKDDMEEIMVKKIGDLDYEFSVFCYAYKKKEIFIKLKTKLKEIYTPIYEKIGKFV